MSYNVSNQDEFDLNYLQGSLIPAQSNYFTIGTQQLRWKDIFLGPGTINITDSVTGNNAAISVANGVFFINGIAQAQLANILVTNLTFSSDNTVQTTAANFYNGSFEDTTTQVSAGTTSANPITFNTTTNSQGVTLGSPTSRIVFTNAGTYQLALTAQFRFSGGASSYNVTMWYAKNGTNVSNSSRTFVLTSGQGAQTMAILTDDVTVTAGQYIQFYWWTDVAPSAGPNGIYLYTTAAGSNPTRPAAPSVSLNVFNVGA